MMKSFSVVALFVMLFSAGLVRPVFAQQDSQKPGFALVTPEWVAQHAKDANVRILDVRPDMKAYFTGHVPNAVYIADAAFRGPKNGVPVQYWPNDMLGNILKAAGVTDRTTVVVYSDGENVLGATMVAYVLDRIGHKDVRVLDGGIAAYQAGQKLTQEYPKYEPGRLKVSDNRKIGVDLAEVRKALKDKSVTFVDARPAKAYQGDVDTWMRNGHIPGAINVEWKSLMSAENPHKFKPAEEIRKVFTDRGVTPDKKIIVYCGTSREVSLEYFLLKHVFNYPNVRLYEGSWTEYSSHPDLPLEKGPGAEAKK